MNIKHYVFIRTVLASVSLLLAASLLQAANITLTVDNVDPANDETAQLDLSKLLPIAEGNTWTYDLLRGTNPSPVQVTAEVGFREKIGGGCLALNPIVFNEELTLYLGNYGEHLSLHGIYLDSWKNELQELLLKFETRYRVYWRDFPKLYTEGAAQANSCQDTEWGRTERTGLVLLEDLTKNLGTPGNSRGEINCSTKNIDLRTGRVSPPVQTGSGTAKVSGAAAALSWSLDALQYTQVADDLRIEMTFNPNIDGAGYDKNSMYMDMTLRPGVGIIDLKINDDASYTMDKFTDLSYTLTGFLLKSSSNQIVPTGKCPENGSVSWLMILLLLGMVFLATRQRSITRIHT